MNKPVWLTSRETAELLSVHEGTLAQWGLRGTGPAYTKVGRSAVRYNRLDVDAWMADRRVETK